MTTAAVVLAAGGGSRFHGEIPKLLAPVSGKPLVRWAVDAAVGAGLDETIVVVGAHDLARVLPEGVTVAVNAGWADGQATSLRAGVDAAGRAGHEAIVVALGDQPGLTPSGWRAVAAASSPMAVAVYGGRRGHPVRLAREVWPELPSTGDDGARALLTCRPELVAEVACVGDPFDVDTVEDLRRWT